MIQRVISLVAGNRLWFNLRILLCLVLAGCNQGDEKSWEKTEKQIYKTIKNVKFSFPASGYAFHNKTKLVKRCFKAIEHNKGIIKIGKFNDTIKIRFLNSREEMLALTKMKASGLTVISEKQLYIVADGKKAPPIQHEVMHLIAMVTWGNPHSTSIWLNEGLAAFAENRCNGYNVSQLYRYFMETHKLIPIDSLTSNFYAQPEMIAYHQSACIVAYLLYHYPVEQFKALWQKGFEQFETIYGKTFMEIRTDMERTLLKNYPAAPAIDWEMFERGCE